MTLLLSNHSPVDTQSPTFHDTFWEYFEKAERIDIAVGYISKKSLNDLMNKIHKNGRPFCNLIIGMHYFEGFTNPQYASLKTLEKFFSDNNLGTVRLVKSFHYHGKIYSFNFQDRESIYIVGSSNLSNIAAAEKYEVDVLIDDGHINSDLSKFLNKLQEASPELSSIPSEEIRINKARKIIENRNNVKDNLLESEKNEVKSTLLFDKSIEIPISTAGKSSLNVYFGKGRENKATGTIAPRGWYEVELIVPSYIRKLPNFPLPNALEEHKIIEVITDDGYSFNCIISGDDNKNFRSEGDLKILGEWLKGRLENAGVLSFGQLVTEEVLKKYGRNSITMIPTSVENKWYLDFSGSAENIANLTKTESDELKLLKEEGVLINQGDIVYRDDNLLEYKGQQIIIYIADYSTYGRFSIIKGTSEYSPYSYRRFHFASCRHVKKEGWDYFASQRKDGKFYAKKTPKGDLEIKMFPCGDCLKKLDYKGFRTMHTNERSEIIKNFDVAEFFESCKSKFS